MIWMTSRCLNWLDSACNIDLKIDVMKILRCYDFGEYQRFHKYHKYRKSTLSSVKNTNEHAAGDWKRSRTFARQKSQMRKIMSLLFNLWSNLKTIHSSKWTKANRYSSANMTRMTRMARMTAESRIINDKSFPSKFPLIERSDFRF
jgi:hypothetical protein